MSDLVLSEEPLFEHQVVTVAPSWLCDANCLHCFLPDGMRRKDDFDPGLMERIVSGLPDHVRVVGFTGGEPFLNWPRYRGLLKQVSDAGRVSTVVTNGVWSLDTERARAVLSEAADLNLMGLALSVDKYHRPSLAIEALVVLLRQAREVGLAVQLKGVGKESRKKIRRIQASGVLDGQENSYTIYSLDRVGKAASLPEDQVRRPELRNCIGAMEPLVGPDGTFYTCCPSQLFYIESPVLKRGNVKEKPIDKLLGDVSRDYLLSAVVCFGPAGVLRLLGRKIPRQVKSRCDLCLSILNKPHLVRSLQRKIRESKELRKEISGRMMVYEECYRPEFVPDVTHKLRR